jgi:carbon monoxide dehydrogenase subunit G
MAPAGPSATWDFLMDVEKAARCVPGVREVAPEGDGRYRATLQAKVGPMRMTLSGTISVLESDRERGEARFVVEASDRRVGGGVKTDMLMRVIPREAGETEVEIITDTTFMGRLGELGQPVIRRKARTTLEEFSQNLLRALEG